jgi:hypothetical protein
MLKINVGENPSSELINRLMMTAMSLDQPPGKVSVGDISHADYPAFVEKAAAVDQGPEDPVEDISDAEVAGQPVAEAKHPGKRGRPSKAEMEARKAAEAAAAATIANAQAEMAQPTPTPSPTPTPVLSGMTLPPGVTMIQPQPVLTVTPYSTVMTATQTAPTFTPAPTVTPTPAALPTVPATAPTADGVVPLEVFKEAFRDCQTRSSGRAFVALKDTTWPDGSPKQGWFTAESVPPEFRVKLLEIWSTL